MSLLVLSAAVSMLGLVLFGVGKRLVDLERQLLRQGDQLRGARLSARYLAGALLGVPCPTGDECRRDAPCEVHRCAVSAERHLNDTQLHSEQPP